MKREYLLKQVFVITFFVLAAISFSFSGFCKTSKHVILVETMSVKTVLESSYWFKIELKERGYIEGENLKLTVESTPKSQRKS